jgi:tetratricopeptide (TPR) repeat protein
MRTPSAIAAAVAATLLSTMMLTGCGGGAETRKGEAMKRGQEYFAAQNWEKARVEFRNALQVAPDDAETRFMNARVLEKLNNIPDSARMYQSTIDVAPDHVGARAALGRMLVFAGNADHALEIITPSLEKHPDDPELLTVRAAARVRQKNIDGAFEDAKKAHELAPASENATAVLASLYQQKGDAKAAIDVVKATLEKTPDSVDLRQVLASLYRGVGEDGLAEEELKRVVEMKPTEMRHRVNLALSYVRAKKLDEAEATLLAAVKDLPGTADPNPKLVYVDFLSTQRSPERGMQALQEFIAKDPKNYPLQFGLGELQMRNHRVDDAVATYNKIIATDEDGVQGLQARLRIAAVDVQARRFDDASKLVAEVLQKNPQDNDALILRGSIALERNDAPSAITDLRAVLRDQPRSVGLLRTLARAYSANDDVALAEDSLRAASEIAPNDVSLKVELAKLLRETRRADASVTVLEEAVKAAPENVGARESLVRSYLAAGNVDAGRRAAEDLKLMAPKAAVGPYLAGLVAHAQHRLDDAQREFDKALELQPNLETLNAYSRLDLERGRGAAAIARTQALLKKEPGNAPLQNMLGELYMATRDAAKAQDAFAQASKMAPKWWLPYRNLGLAKVTSKDLSGAAATYQSGIQATNYQAALVSDLATLFERQNRVDDAIKLYEELYKRNPRLDLAANNLAMLLATYKNDQASLDRARDLSAPFASSQVVAFLDTHGWVRFKRGEFTQAVPVLERAVSESPDSKLIRFHLGMAQYRAGQREQAIANLERALDGDAKFSGADEARSVLTSLKKGGSAG